MSVRHNEAPPVVGLRFRDGGLLRKVLPPTPELPGPLPQPPFDVPEGPVPLHRPSPRGACPEGDPLVVAERLKGFHVLVVSPPEPGSLPERYDATGAVVPDWAMIPARVYAAGLAGDGHRTMTSCLESIAAWLSDGRADIDTFPWAQLRHSHTSAVRAALLRAVHSGRYAAATANKHLAALRGTLKAAWRMGQMTTDDYVRTKDLKPAPGSRLPAGRVVSLEELATILGRFADDQSPGAVRDRAVIALAYFSGARRGELAGLTMADLTTEPLTLRILGKGNKERPVPLPDEAAAYLDPWLSLRGSSAGSLFCPVNRGTVHPEKSLTGEAIRQILQRRARAAGVAAVSPHDLRRTYAGDLLDSGADLPTVQRLLGHNSPATTSRYDRRDERTSRQAVSRLTLASVEDEAEEHDR